MKRRALSLGWLVAAVLLLGACKSVDISAADTSSFVVRESISFVGYLYFAVMGVFALALSLISLQQTLEFVRKRATKTWGDLVAALFIGLIAAVFCVPQMREAVSTTELAFSGTNLEVSCARRIFFLRRRNWTLKLDQVTRISFSTPSTSNASFEVLSASGRFCKVESFAATTEQQRVIRGICEKELGERCR
ncbi:MAG: hypothetical protein U0165_10865 [Polyangiaceae bacterium]